jgi:hypothetical protein
VLDALMAFLNGPQGVGAPGHGKWVKRLWTKELTIVVKKVPKTAVYKRPYLFNTDTNGVITAQNKAWMDTVVMCQFLELCIVPWFESLGAQYPHLCYDNCGPHKTEAVRKCMDDCNISGDPLAPNVTDHMQVIDLVVNGPFKAGMRREQAMYLYDQFQEYRRAVFSNPGLPWSPKPITLHMGTLMTIRVYEKMRADKALSAGIVRAYVSTGLLPRGDGSYAVYQGRKAAVEWIRHSLPQALRAEPTIQSDEFRLTHIVGDMGKVQFYSSRPSTFRLPLAFHILLLLLFFFSCHSSVSSIGFYLLLN